MTLQLASTARHRLPLNPRQKARPLAAAVRLVAFAWHRRTTQLRHLRSLGRGAAGWTLVMASVAAYAVGLSTWVVGSVVGI